MLTKVNMQSNIGDIILWDQGQGHNERLSEIHLYVLLYFNQKL